MIQRNASPNTIPSAMQRICWHHVRVPVPCGWEVTAYSVEDRAGRLEFGSREGLMGIVSWEPCEREPDRQTTMLTFLRRNILGEKSARDVGFATLRTASIGHFLLGWTEAGGPCQALAYGAARRKLIRWILEPVARRDSDWPQTLRPMLEAFDFNDGDLTEYQLHGIHALLPRSYALEDMVVLPANVMIAFENSKNKRRATFRRWGLPEMILAGKSLAEFHAGILKTSGVTVQKSSPCRVNGMEACLSECDAPREHHMDRFMGRRWPGGTAVIWLDHENRRLHAFEQVGPENSDPLVFSDCLPGGTLETGP